MTEIKWTKFSDQLPYKNRDIFCFVESTKAIVLYSLDEVEAFSIGCIANEYDQWAYVPIPQPPIINDFITNANVPKLTETVLFPKTLNLDTGAGRNEL